MSYDSSYSVPPGNFVSDSDTFGIPTFGGPVAARYNTVTYEDTSAKDLFHLPAGAVIIDYTVQVTEAFNSGDSGTLEVGLGTNADALVNDLNVLAAGDTRNDAGGGATLLLDELFGDPLEEDTVVTATYTGAGTAADEGEAVVIVYYMLR